MLVLKKELIRYVPKCTLISNKQILTKMVIVEKINFFFAVLKTKVLIKIRANNITENIKRHDFAEYKKVVSDPFALMLCINIYESS